MKKKNRTSRKGNRSKKTFKTLSWLSTIFGAIGVITTLPQLLMFTHKTLLILDGVVLKFHEYASLFVNSCFNYQKIKVRYDRF